MSFTLIVFAQSKQFSTLNTLHNITKSFHSIQINENPSLPNKRKSLKTWFSKLTERSRRIALLVCKVHFSAVSVWRAILCAQISAYFLRIFAPISVPHLPDHHFRSNTSNFTWVIWHMLGKFIVWHLCWQWLDPLGHLPTNFYVGLCTEINGIWFRATLRVYCV